MVVLPFDVFLLASAAALRIAGDCLYVSSLVEVLLFL